MNYAQNIDKSSILRILRIKAHEAIKVDYVIGMVWN